MRTPLDPQRCRLLEDTPAQGLDSSGFAQCQIERMDMATAHVQQAANIAFACDACPDAAFVEQLQLRVAVALPQALLRLQMVHLPGRQRRKYTAVLEIALDAIARHTVADDTSPFECHGAQKLRLLGADGLFDDVDVTAITVDDLPAVAARGAETYPRGFQHGDREAVLQQK